MIVGFGSPFAGVIALSITTTASLGKMFSEAVEHIDPGPIEALTATGANRLQVILYAVIPSDYPGIFVVYDLPLGCQCAYFDDYWLRRRGWDWISVIDED